MKHSWVHRLDRLGCCTMVNTHKKRLNVIGGGKKLIEIIMKYPVCSLLKGNTKVQTAFKFGQSDLLTCWVEWCTSKILVLLGLQKDLQLHTKCAQVQKLPLHSVTSSRMLTRRLVSKDLAYVSCLFFWGGIKLFWPTIWNAWKYCNEKIVMQREKTKYKKEWKCFCLYPINVTPISQKSCGQFASRQKDLPFFSQTFSVFLFKSERRQWHNRLSCLRVVAFASRCLCAVTARQDWRRRGGRGKSELSRFWKKNPPLFRFDSDSKRTRQTPPPRRLAGCRPTGTTRSPEEDNRMN